MGRWGQSQGGPARGPPTPNSRRARGGHLLHAPEHRLHKHSQALDVDPGDKGFAEIHLEPPEQRALQGQESR